MEVFSGVKNSKLARIYPIAVMVKSTFTIITVIILSPSFGRVPIYVILLCLQLIYLLIMVGIFY